MVPAARVTHTIISCGTPQDTWGSLHLHESGRSGLSDGSMDPEHRVSQGADTVTDTISVKTDTILFRSPRYGLRSAGIGMYRARKKQHLALFQATISGRIGLYYSGMKRTPLFRPRICESYRRVHSEILRSVEGIGGWGLSYSRPRGGDQGGHPDTPHPLKKIRGKGGAIG